MFATLATVIFRNSPWHLVPRQYFYCRQFYLYNVETIETYYGSHQSQRTGLTHGPKVMSVTVIRVVQCYQKTESQRIKFTFEEYPLLNMGTLRSHPWPGWAVTRLIRTQTQSASSSSAPATFQLPRFFSHIVCN